jgi:proteic killer suppression protein
VKLAFSSKKLKRQLTEQRQMAKTFGHVMPALNRRLALLQAAPVLAEIPHTPPARRHELFGNWRVISQSI